MTTERDELRRYVRRVIAPEQPELLSAGLDLADRLAERGGDVALPKLPHSMGAMLPFVLHDALTTHLVMPDGDEVGRDEVSALLPRERARLRLMLRPLTEPFSCPDIPDPDEEAASRLRDLVNLRGGASLGVARCLAPSADPEEARVWILAAASRAGLALCGDDLIPDGPAPAPISLHVDWISGNCPVQAEGFIRGRPFYYRARGERQTLEVDDDLVLSERVIGGAFSAGWLTNAEASEFITRAALVLERRLALGTDPGSVSPS